MSGKKSNQEWTSSSGVYSMQTTVESSLLEVAKFKKVLTRYKPFETELLFPMRSERPTNVISRPRSRLTPPISQQNFKLAKLSVYTEDELV